MTKLFTIEGRFSGPMEHIRNVVFEPSKTGPGMTTITYQNGTYTEVIGNHVDAYVRAVQETDRKSFALSNDAGFVREMDDMQEVRGLQKRVDDMSLSIVRLEAQVRVLLDMNEKRR